nr:HigA family addiction module antitoxin [Ferrovum sp.]
MKMHNPPHPGLTLRDDVLPALGLTVTEAAQQLNVAHATLSRVINGRSAISPEMALRIEAWLGVERGGEARLWIAEQSAYDMWQAEQRIKVTPLHVQPAPIRTRGTSYLPMRYACAEERAPPPLLIWVGRATTFFAGVRS